MLKPIYTHKFDKDVKLAKRRGFTLTKLNTVIAILISEDPVPPRMSNHKLGGSFDHCWECHIEPDWLLIYQKTAATITFLRTGTHADLF